MRARHPVTHEPPHVVVRYRERQRPVRVSLVVAVVGRARRACGGMHRTWKYRLYPTRAQERELGHQLDIPRESYNAAARAADLRAVEHMGRPIGNDSRRGDVAIFP